MSSCKKILNPVSIHYRKYVRWDFYKCYVNIIIFINDSVVVFCPKSYKQIILFALTFGISTRYTMEISYRSWDYRNTFRRKSFSTRSFQILPIFSTRSWWQFCSVGIYFSSYSKSLCDRWGHDIIDWEEICQWITFDSIVFPWQNTRRRKIFGPSRMIEFSTCVLFCHSILMMRRTFQSCLTWIIRLMSLKSVSYRDWTYRRENEGVRSYQEDSNRQNGRTSSDCIVLIHPFSYMSCPWWRTSSPFWSRSTYWWSMIDLIFQNLWYVFSSLSVFS